MIRDGVTIADWRRRRPVRRCNAHVRADPIMHVLVVENISARPRIDSGCGPPECALYHVVRGANRSLSRQFTARRPLRY